MNSNQEMLTLQAYHLSGHDLMPIVPASKFRDWMDKVGGNYAYRCLPLLMANQMGWVILNTRRFGLYWDGRTGPDAIRIAFLQDNASDITHVGTGFGYGILTFHLSYLFRTPAGYNLQIRGVPNYVKNGIQPLEGIVETDWSPMPCTMNWKITLPNQLITFDVGEPICMIVPRRRHELEEFQPSVSELAEFTEQEELSRLWVQSRQAFLAASHANPEYQKTYFPWQGHYFSGRFLPDEKAEVFEDHQTKVRLALFKANWTPET